VPTDGGTVNVAISLTLRNWEFRD
ncbi:hypothetical protein A2U01_0058178, partial [Trifolium medium]|nr:hypothetical protein [Trifolium medium]